MHHDRQNKPGFDASIKSQIGCLVCSIILSCSDCFADKPAMHRAVLHYITASDSTSCMKHSFRIFYAIEAIAYNKIVKIG